MYFTISDIAKFPNRTIVLTAEQTFYGGLSVGGGWGVGGGCVVQGGEGGCAVGDVVCVKEGTPLTLCE